MDVNFQIQKLLSIENIFNWEAHTIEQTSYTVTLDAPYQKGACEVNHELIRRIIPKETSMKDFIQRPFSD